MKANTSIVNHSFLLGLLLIALAGVWISFVLGSDVQGLQTQVIIGILTILAAITVLNLNNVHKSHLLFTIYFVVALLYSASIWVGGRSTPVIAVVALASAIGFLSSIFGNKDIGSMSRPSSAVSMQHASVARPAKRVVRKKSVARRKPATRRRTAPSKRRVVRRAPARRRTARRAPVRRRVVRRTPARRRPVRRATRRRTITRRRRR